MTDDASSLPERVESFIRDIDEATTLVHVFNALIKRLSQLGFQYFAYWLIFPAEGPRQPLCITNYPEEWSEYYLTQNFGSHDYVGRYAAKSTTPFIWCDIVSQNKLSDKQKQIFEEGASAGLRAGGTIPIHGPGTAKATFSVANNMQDDAFNTLFNKYRHEMQLMATYVHEKVISFNLHEPIDGVVKMTPREIEILTWMAKGKSRWEVGVILDISEDTVKAHLVNVRQKLGAANTSHAIAIALMNGFVLP